MKVCVLIGGYLAQTQQYAVAGLSGSYVDEIHIQHDDYLALLEHESPLN